MLTGVVLAAGLADPMATPEADKMFHKGTTGLSLTVPRGGGETVGAIYFVSPKIAAFGELGLAWQRTTTASEIEDVTTTTLDWAISAGVRLYTWRWYRLSTYLQPAARVGEKTVPAGDDTVTTRTIGASGDLGAEVLLTQHLSLSGTIGITLESATQRNETATSLSSVRSALHANFYW